MRGPGCSCRTGTTAAPSAAKSRGAGGDVDGMLAEQVVLSQEGVIRFPEHLSFEEAATLPLAALTAWHALVPYGQTVAGDTVVLLGTGGVSIFALQFTKLSGADHPHLQQRRQACAGQGTGATRSSTTKRLRNGIEKVRELTGGAGADHVVEVGGAGTLNKSLRAVRTAGRISLIGVLAGASGPVDTVVILHRALSVQGIYVGSREMFAAMNRAVALHKLKPAIDRVFDFGQAVDALRHLESG